MVQESRLIATRHHGPVTVRVLPTGYTRLPYAVVAHAADGRLIARIDCDQAGRAAELLAEPSCFLTLA